MGPIIPEQRASGYQHLRALKSLTVNPVKPTRQTAPDAVTKARVLFVSAQPQTPQIEGHLHSHNILQDTHSRSE